MANYASILSETPQTKRAKKEQVKNSAGGYSFKLDKWSQLDRFLILGSMGGTYYINQSDLTRTNYDALTACLEEDGLRTVNHIREVSQAGRAAKNSPAIFALAIAAKTAKSDIVRQAAYLAMPDVCRIGTHLFEFMEYVKFAGGVSGSGLRRALRRWYQEKDTRSMTYQMLKYRQRNGWSHRDVLRLAKPVADDASMENFLYGLATGKKEAGDVPKNLEGSDAEAAAMVEAFYRAQEEGLSVTEIASIVRENGLTREMIPTTALNSIRVWDALLERMPMTAMLRNLGKMTDVGLLKIGSVATRKVVESFKNADAVKRSRLHPAVILNAMMVYQTGHGRRGSLSWTPVSAIIDSLEDAYMLSFGNVEPTGKRLLLALDVSGSMSWGACAGLDGLTPAQGSAAMAMVTARTEPNYEIRGFADNFRDLKITAKTSLQGAVDKVSRQNFGGTDMSLPMLWAMKNNLDFDAFVVYTDSETWAGHLHPFQALKRYRSERVKDARMIVVGMEGNPFSIADPSDPGMLDVVGFDTAAPRLIGEFAAARL